MMVCAAAANRNGEDKTPSVLKREYCVGPRAIVPVVHISNKDPVNI